MIKRIKNLFNLFISSISLKPETITDPLSEICRNDTDIVVDIQSDDIINGIPNDSKSCIIALSLKREGYHNVIVSEYDITLSDDSRYEPQKFSDHWKCFIGSSKLKPMTIVYKKIIKY